MTVGELQKLLQDLPKDVTISSYYHSGVLFEVDIELDLYKDNGKDCVVIETYNRED